jgi:hypothetical protein
VTVGGDRVSVPGLGGSFRLLPRGRIRPLEPAQRPACQ